MPAVLRRHFCFIREITLPLTQHNGVPYFQAEIIPFKPDPDNAGVGIMRFDSHF